MWVFEEEVTIGKDSPHAKTHPKLTDKPQKITDVINTLKENVKYLPDVPLPHNIHANPSLEDSVKGATILIFNLPHQFIKKTCESIVGKVVPYARGVSCIKGVDVSEKGIELFSESIGKTLGLYCGALSGANIATEVAKEKFSETTVAYDPPPMDSKNPTPQGSPRQSVEALPLTEGAGSQSGGKAKLTPLPDEFPPVSYTHLTLPTKRIV